MRGRNNKIWLSLAIGVCFAGCEELPPSGYRISASADNRAAEVVTTSGRGGYNWNTVANEFKVERPPVFPFRSRIDPQKLAANYQAAQQREPFAPGPIEGMEADVYAWFRNYTEPYAAEEPLLIVPPPEADTPRSFCLSPRGNLLVTIDNQISVWDIENKKTVKQYPSPTESPQWVHIDSANSAVVIGEDKALFRYSFKDDKIETWNSPRGSIVAVAAARDRANYAILDDEGGMVHLKSDFKSYDRINDAQVSNGAVAIAPDASTIFAVSNGYMMSWTLMPKVRPSKSYPSPVLRAGQSIEDFQPVVGKFEQRWISRSSAFAFRGDEPLFKLRFQDGMTRAHRFNSDIVAAFNASNGSDDWLCILFRERQADGKMKFCLRDVACKNHFYSSPFVISDSQPKSIQVNAMATRVAVEDGESGLRVLTRRPWVSTDERIVGEQIAKLVFDGRFEQAELCAETIRKALLTPEHLSGEVAFGHIAKSIGESWRAISNEPQRSENNAILRRLDEWLKEGSRFARLCHFHSQFENEPTLAIRVVPSRDINIDKRAIARQIQPELLKDAAQPDAPTAVLELLIDTCMVTNSEFEMVEDLVLAHLENHPTELGPLASVCNWVSPSRGGFTDDLPNTLDAVASVYPEELRDRIYAKLAIETLVLQPDTFLLSNSNIDLLRLRKGAQPIQEQNLLQDYEVEALFGFMYESRNTDLAYWFAAHKDHWLIPSRYLLDRRFFYHYEEIASNQEPTP